MRLGVDKQNPRKTVVRIRWLLARFASSTELITNTDLEFKLPISPSSFTPINRRFSAAFHTDRAISSLIDFVLWSDVVASHRTKWSPVKRVSRAGQVSASCWIRGRWRWSRRSRPPWLTRIFWRSLGYSSILIKNHVPNPLKAAANELGKGIKRE